MLLSTGDAFAAFTGRSTGVINRMKQIFQTNPYYKATCFSLGIILLYTLLNFHTEKAADYFIALFVLVSCNALLFFQSFYSEEFIFTEKELIYQVKYLFWSKIIFKINYLEIQRIEKNMNFQGITNYKILYLHDSELLEYSFINFKPLLFYLIRPNIDQVLQQLSILTNKHIDNTMV